MRPRGPSSQKAQADDRHSSRHAIVLLSLQTERRLGSGSDRGLQATGPDESGVVGAFGETGLGWGEFS